VAKLIADHNTSMLDCGDSSMLVVHLGSLKSGWLPPLTGKDLVRPITILSRLFIVTL